jgi:exodeoxyribonuclease VII small subunit
MAAVFPQLRWSIVRRSIADIGETPMLRSTFAATREYIIGGMAKKTQAVPKNFEDGMRELESILSDVERGEMGVEESLVRYERGAFLIQHCRGVLNKAQMQIEALAKPPEAAGTDEIETNPVEEV